MDAESVPPGLIALALGHGEGFVRGLALGLAVAAPVGPMSLLCMRQTLARGWLAGLASGLGIATADGVYGAVAAFGLVAVSDVLTGQQPWLRVIGGLVMLWLGLGAMRAKPAGAAVARSGGGIDGRGDGGRRDGEGRSSGGGGLLRAYAGTFALTMMNPSTILSFAALFAGLGLGAGASGEEGSAGGAILAPALLVCGVFLGSALWWLLVTGGISAARTRLSPRVQNVVNVAAGLVLVAFGIVAMASVAG